MRKNLWRYASAVWTAALALCLFGNVAIAALELKVGYFDYDGYVAVDENGHITGYAGEILDMLVEANPHWYFVPVLFDRATFDSYMQRGYASLSLQTPRTEASPWFYTFSEYPIGVEQGIFYTGTDQHIYYEDFAFFEGMRIGAIENDTQIILFDEYQTSNGFTVEYLLFASLADMKQALADKEIDGLIYGSIVEQADLKIVARYAEVPLHVAGNDWSGSFVGYFDQVIGDAMEENPYFLDELYAKYYGDAPRAVQAMTEEEEKAAEQARIAEEEAAAARRAEEEARRAAEIEAAVDASNEVDEEPADQGASDEDDREKTLTQAGFITVVILLVLFIVVALIRNKGGKSSKAKTEESATKSDISSKPDESCEKDQTQTARQADSPPDETAPPPPDSPPDAGLQEQADSPPDETALPPQPDSPPDAELQEQADSPPDETAPPQPDSPPDAGFQEQSDSPQAAELHPETGQADNIDDIAILQSGFDALAGSDWEQDESQALEYTDDQIRGEIYLSGLMISLQPRYSANKNTIIGAESSISCRHPIRDMVFPEELVQSLIQKAKLHILDRYLFESLCMSKPHEKSESFEEFEIVVPLFSESALRPDFSRWYIETVKKYQIPPEFFRLDIAYDWQPEQDRHIYETLRELVDAGFHVALKDVGIANYPLKLLCDVEWEAIVVDEQLLVDALGNERKRKLLAALKDLCTQMDFRLEANRIDSRDKLQLVTKVGCQVFQGNFLTRAIPFEQFWDFTRKARTRTASW